MARQTPSLQSIFEAYAAFGSREPGAGAGGIDGKAFAKMMKVDADLLHARARSKGAKKMTFAQFESVAIDGVAAKRGLEREQVVAAIVGTGGPKANGTKAEAVRFYDDKSLFTGVHAHGGPSTVDGPKDLSGLCDRTPADVRGTKADRGSFSKADRGSLSKADAHGTIPAKRH
eukprot:scaffold14.g1157.t1